VELKLTTTGEYGKSVGKIKKFASKDDKNPQEYKLHNLGTYNIGAELKVNNFKLINVWLLTQQEHIVFNAKMVKNKK